MHREWDVGNMKWFFRTFLTEAKGDHLIYLECVCVCVTHKRLLKHNLIPLVFRLNKCLRKEKSLPAPSSIIRVAPSTKMAMNIFAPRK